MYLYRIDKNDKIEKIVEHHINKEEEVQKRITSHLYEFFQINLIKEFHKTTTGHGEIDALGIDDDNRPVIIEFKRKNKKDVITQSLDYAHWLVNNNEEFAQLVIKENSDLLKIDDDGDDKSLAKIDFKNYRILIIAQDFTTRQIHATEMAHPNIELVDYTIFKHGEESILGLEYLSKESSISKEFDINHYFKNKNQKFLKIFQSIENKLKKNLPEDSYELYTKNEKNIAYKTGRRRFIKIRPRRSKLVVGFYLGDKYNDIMVQYKEYKDELRQQKSGWVYYDIYDESYANKPIFNELLLSSHEYSS